MYEKYLIYYFIVYIIKMFVSFIEIIVINKIDSCLMFLFIYDVVVLVVWLSSLVVCVYLNILLLFMILIICLYLISFCVM